MTTNQSTVTTFRTDRDLQRKIKTLRRAVQPSRFNVKRASTSDVIRAGLETLYAQVVPRDQPANQNEATHEKPIVA